MMKLTFVWILFVSFVFISCAHQPNKIVDMKGLAEERKTDLKLSVYIVAQTIDQLFRTEEGRREAVSVLNCNGISKVYLEAYRSGLVISPDLLRSSAAFLKENGFEVVGGIATVPGPGFGKAQEGTLTWFNWQNQKTQDDLRKVMEDSAPIFDTFIIDDFLCTADTSLESKAARGNRSWPEYRRSLLTELAQSVLINPAKAKNPAIKIIIKYPQSYDRFHLFGYDVATEPALFDGVWVGTETRGQYTQRYGFVQPYEGFINYRWISTLAGNKIGAAWFDHGDCTDIDFIEQAYQSVLAGAKELVMFNFDSFISGHPGHHLLRQDFKKLADLAREIATRPVVGVAGYKPPNSDAGGDLYLMDYIGMFGISLVPVSKYPENSKVIFLPSQAAADREILPKILKSIEKGTKIIMTAGFIVNANGGDKIASLAGIKYVTTPSPKISESVLNEGIKQKLKFPLTTDFKIVPEDARVLLEVSAGEPFLIQKNNLFVIDTHTFSQQDFDAVGEVLLCPRQIGLLERPRPWMNTIRSAFTEKDGPVLDASSRISMQHLTGGGFFLHNYNQEKAEIYLRILDEGSYVDGFSRKPIEVSDKNIRLEMAPRSRIWIRRD